MKESFKERVAASLGGLFLGTALGWLGSDLCVEYGYGRLACAAALAVTLLTYAAWCAFVGLLRKLS